MKCHEPHSLLVQFIWLHCWHLLQGNKSDSYLHYDDFSRELILCRSVVRECDTNSSTGKIKTITIFVFIGYVQNMEASQISNQRCSYAVYILVVNLCAKSIHNSHQEFSLTLPDASKATFTASPSSCFLANRNKAAPLPSDTSVKNECLAEQTYVSLSASQPSSVPSGLNTFATGDSENMQLTGMYQFF